MFLTIVLLLDRRKLHEQKKNKKDKSRGLNINLKDARPYARAS